MTKEEQDEHRRIIFSLEERVRDQYAMTMTEVPVRDTETKAVIGEIDLLGIIGKVWDIYEVKCNDGFRKAKRQLEALRDYLSDCATINTYYYSGRQGKIMKVE